MSAHRLVWMLQSVHDGRIYNLRIICNMDYPDKVHALPV